MNAQAILQKIEDDARASAAQAKSDMQTKALQLKEASLEKIERLRSDLIKQAEVEGDALRERMRRMAELDLRKQLLQKKREVIAEAFQMAQAELCKTSAKKVRAFLLTQTTAAAQGDEQLIIGENNAAWFDDAFVRELNTALTVSGKPAQITLSTERRAGAMGAILSRSGTEVYCTFEAMLDSVRAEMETEIAQILFTE